MSKFNDYRFNGLNHRKESNKYFTMSRVSDDESRIIVKVADCHLVKTKYGYALILDDSHVVFLKDWAVSSNWYGNEVMLDREYFNVKEWGSWEDFDSDPENCTWSHYLAVAKEQRDSGNKVMWAR